MYLLLVKRLLVIDIILLLLLKRHFIVILGISDLFHVATVFLGVASLVHPFRALLHVRGEEQVVRDGFGDRID